LKLQVKAPSFKVGEGGWGVVNILVELTRSNITLNLHYNLGVFSWVSQLKFQNHTRSHAFTYCIQNQMHFFPFAQNHTPILVSQDTCLKTQCIYGHLSHVFTICIHTARLKHMYKAPRLSLQSWKVLIGGGGIAGEEESFTLCWLPSHLYIQIPKDSNIDGPCVNICICNKECKATQRPCANHLNPCKPCECKPHAEKGEKPLIFIQCGKKMKPHTNA
jgi:hypothetical protein